MAAASLTTESVEDMFWEHIEADSRMRGKWLYFGTNDNLLRATLALLPKWKLKKKKVVDFHAALMDKHKYIRGRGGNPWKDRQTGRRCFFVARREELPPWMGTQNVTTWICFGTRDMRQILPHAVLTEDKRILREENDPDPNPTAGLKDNVLDAGQT